MEPNPDFDFSTAGDDPYHYPRSRRRLRKRRQGSSSQGTNALIFGLLGLLVFWPLGIAAIMIGNAALRENPEDGNARAGVVLGWVSILLTIAAVCFFCVIFALLAGPLTRFRI